MVDDCRGYFLFKVISLVWPTHQIFHLYFQFSPVFVYAKRYCRAHLQTAGVDQSALQIYFQDQ